VEHLDVLIVGAGLSGIDAAYRVQTSCPGKSYAILESRDAMGGTWDLFRYPGIRSDSDMHTLGFPFRPWKNPKAIADGPSILAYIHETAAEHGIDRKIRYGKRVVAAKWSTGAARWTVDVRDVATGEITQLTASFLFLCVGYYDYEKGYTPDFPGRERFRGRIVHPQKWTPDVDWAGKRVVVIGSGATAVTLVPALSRDAAHVTMLQRSPTYIMSVPNRDPIAAWLRRKLPTSAADDAVRWKNVLLGMGIYAFSRKFPKRAKRVLLAHMKKQLGDEGHAVAKHFTPSYDPWDQRMCLVPDSDLFEAIRAGRVSVVTDRIDTFTERGIRLESGDELEADLIVTATGLNLKLFGGIAVDIDGRRVEPKDSLVYKGMMVSDVPNLAFAIGYTNASWTLKCDLTAQYVCRLIRHMDDRGFKQCVARRPERIDEEPLIDFSSGYVRRSIDSLPRQGATVPWKLHQNYARDLLMIKHARLTDDAMQFS
jgi:cation diffusion facilitator CzcD-associated flavoprotein CzcO